MNLKRFIIKLAKIIDLLSYLLKNGPDSEHSEFTLRRSSFLLMDLRKEILIAQGKDPEEYYTPMGENSTIGLAKQPQSNEESPE